MTLARLRCVVLALTPMVVFIGGAGLVHSATILRIENCDSDPGWMGVGNTSRVYDFGFSNTNNAGGAAAGELGGSFESLIDAGAGVEFYADTDIGTLTQQDVLTASFRFVAPSATAPGSHPTSDGAAWDAFSWIPCEISSFFHVRLK